METQIGGSILSNDLTLVVNGDRYGGTGARDVNGAYDSVVLYKPTREAIRTREGANNIPAFIQTDGLQWPVRLAHLWSQRLPSAS